MDKPIYTSCGVIRNADLPRVGVIRLNSEKLNQDVVGGFPFDENHIDLGYESYLQDLKDQGLSEEEIEKEMDHYTCDGSQFLVGDWKHNADGTYTIDRNGTAGYAATYSSDSNNVCVEWSKTTRRCHHTSPCYMTASGDGPCGDLDHDGDIVLAYDLPAEFYNEKEK